MVIYFLTAAGCPEWSLEVPQGGDMTCIKDDQTDHSTCDISCPSDKDFVIDPDLYVCVFGGSWEPHNYVEDCTGLNTYLVSIH